MAAACFAPTMRQAHVVAGNGNLTLYLGRSLRRCWVRCRAWALVMRWQVASREDVCVSVLAQGCCMTMGTASQGRARGSERVQIRTNTIWFASE